MGEIAELLRCDPSNVTGIADALEARGLARRRPSDADRRVKALELTAKGEKLRQRAMGELSEPPEWLRGLSRRTGRRSATCCAAPPKPLLSGERFGSPIDFCHPVGDKSQ